MRKFLKPAIFLLGFLPLAWLGWDIYRGNVGGFPIEQAEIRTGRWALRFLILTLAITPLRRFTGWHWIIGYRRTFGLFTFFYATVHLSMYVGLDFFFAWDLMLADIRDHRYIYIGFATFLTLIPLAITSTKGMIRRLGRRWQKLHRLVYLTMVGALLHYLWAIKVVTPGVVAHVAVAIALLGWRVWDWRKRQPEGSDRTGGAERGGAERGGSARGGSTQAGGSDPASRSELPSSPARQSNAP